MANMSDGGGGDSEPNPRTHKDDNKKTWDYSAIFPLGNENTESLLRARIFKLLRSQRIDYKELILPGCVVFSLAGRYDNPIPIRFLTPIDCLKIPALAQWPFFILLLHVFRRLSQWLFRLLLKAW